MILTIVLAKLRVGLSAKPVEMHEKVGVSNLVDEHLKSSQIYQRIKTGDILRATFPLWGTIFLLVLTRLPQLGIKNLLMAESPGLEISLGAFGNFGISAALVLSLKNIFGTNSEWSHSLLYVPSILPFGLIALITFVWEKKFRNISTVFKTTVTQMQNPTKALIGALIFVNLLMMGGDSSPVAIIGKSLADVAGKQWQFFAPFLGSLGSFFSGSNTISNLTFGAIQDSIANNLNLSRTTILAMQSAGGAMGSMVSINNIVAVASVLALNNKEGFILKQTVKAMLVYGVIVAFFAWVIF